MSLFASDVLMDWAFSAASYIDEHYVDERQSKYRRSQLLAVEEKAMQFEEIAFESVKAIMPAPMTASDIGIEDLVGNLDEPFSTTLLRLIDAKGKSDVEIYKRANLDRKLFSKVRNPDYRPSKKTAVALSVALELTLNETGDLLNRAGFALSRSQKFDVIVEYFITRGKYDVFEINNVLFSYDQPLLGG